MPVLRQHLLWRAGAPADRLIHLAAADAVAVADVHEASRHGIGTTDENC
jgi:hypothetical protein